ACAADIDAVAKQWANAIALLLSKISDVDHAFAADKTPKRASWIGLDRPNLPHPRDKFRFTADYNRMNIFAVVGQTVPMRRATQAHGLFKHRVEHGHEVAGRGVDDPQHFSGRCLLVPRLS